MKPRADTQEEKRIIDQHSQENRSEKLKMLAKQI